MESLKNIKKHKWKDTIWPLACIVIFSILIL